MILKEVAVVELQVVSDSFVASWTIAYQAPLSIRPEVDTRPKPNNRDSVKEVEKGTESWDSQCRSYKPKSILEIIFC